MKKISIENRLKKAREASGLSTSQAEKKLGLAKGLVKDFETGEATLNQEGLKIFADLYNVNLDWLLGEEVSLDKNLLFNLEPRLKNLCTEDKDAVLNLIKMLNVKQCEK